MTKQLNIGDLMAQQRLTTTYNSLALIPIVSRKLQVLWRVQSVDLSTGALSWTVGFLRILWTHWSIPALYTSQLPARSFPKANHVECGDHATLLAVHKPLSRVEPLGIGFTYPLIAT